MPENIEAIFDRMEASDHHLQRMANYANERFHRFPNITSIAVNVGVAFGVDFQVMVTWQRPKNLTMTAERPKPLSWLVGILRRLLGI